jgi:Domain of unknown function (DUF6504)
VSARRFSPAEPVEVWCDARTGLPQRLRWRGRLALVATVERSWRADEGWWRGDREAASRAYHRVFARDGLRCVLYRDLASGRWYLETILD